MTDAPSHTKQSSAWVFTLNNPASIEAPRVFADSAKYCIWQEEKGESGTRHLQGYVYFKGSRKLSTLKNLLPAAHFEVRRGTHEQAKAYSSKEDTRVSGPYEFGEEPVGQGTRTDLTSLKRALDDDLPISTVWDDHFPVMLKYFKAANEYKRVKNMANPRHFKSVCIVLYGGTGSGKTYTANKYFAGAYWLGKPQEKGPLWFDGYDGKQNLVIDEFYGWISFDLLLRITDNTPLQLPIKGGFVGFAPKYIIFTSNQPPESWYNYSKFPHGKDPLFRRLDLIIEKRNRSEFTIWKRPGHPDPYCEPHPNTDQINLEDYFPDLRLD